MRLTAQEQAQQDTQKKYLLIAFAVIFLCAVGVAVFVCLQTYRAEKESLLAENRELLEKTTFNTVKSITEWSEQLKSQTDRISSSELYRLFTKEAGALDDERLKLLAEGKSFPTDQEGGHADENSLVEQVPILRNVLVDFVKYSGLTDARIVNPQGQILLSYKSPPTPVSPAQLVAVRAAIEKIRPATAPLRMSGEKLVLDFADPFHTVLSGDRGEAPVGAFVVTSLVETNVARFLSNENRQNADIMVHILQNHDGIWEEVKPTGLQPAPEAVKELFEGESGGFVTFGMHKSMLDGDAYSLALRAPGTGWWIVAELPREAVDKVLSAKALGISMRGVLASFSLLLLLPLFWWFTVGRGQHATAVRFQELYHTIQHQKQFLDSINISLEVGLFMVNEQGEIQLCNRAFARIVRQEEEALSGVELSTLFVAMNQKKVAAGMQHVLKEGKAVSFEVDRRYSDGIFIYRTALFPFVDSSGGGTGGVVGTMQDITDFRRRNVLQQRQQMQIMNAFVHAVESVDPYLGGHSQMMKSLSALLGKQLALSNKDTRTIAIAAELSQVGKMSISPAILHKQGALTPDELAEVRKAPENAYKILKGISFDLPVADAVYAMNELMDGSGYPRGLQGQDIPIHARVLAVLNAFCAMTSPRFYRKGMEMEKSIEILQNNPGFDQTVVQALHRALCAAEGVSILRQRQSVQQAAGSA